MKSYKHLLILLFSLMGLSTFAQTSKKTLNYQAVILDPKAIDIPGASIVGQPLNKGNVCLRFSLLNAQGGLDYEETQSLTTDEYGLVNVAIGTGAQAQAGNSTSIYKSFDSVMWNSSVKSLKVSVSYDGCSSFKQVSSQALNYTPYALYAEAVDYKNVREAPTKLSQFSNDAGFLIPKDLDPLKTDIKTNSSQIATANQNIADNKQASEATFLVVNQSITSLDTKVADNKKNSDATFLVVNQSITSLDTQVAANTTAIKETSNSIGTINSKLNDQQNQIVDNRNQITATSNTMNAQIGGLQGQINTTNSTVSNLTGTAEIVSNKSTETNLGGANPSDQLYPSQKAAKTYVDQSISQIASSGVPNATTLAPGKIQLSGDLGGTATNPTVPELANKANIASPTFTGTPTAPTQTSGDNSTKLATTAFVATAVSAANASPGGVPYTGATGPVDLGAYNLTVNGIVVGIGGGDNTNTSIGNSSMRANTGERNTAFGNSALQSNSVGTDNTAVGYFALQKNTATTTYGTLNTAMGSYSLQSNTTGKRNSAVGAFSLQNNDTGYDNSAFGYYSLLTNTSGYKNTAYGHSSLRDNKTGKFNTASGALSLAANTEGSDNTANGYGSLNRNTTGYSNTAHGAYSLIYNTTGYNNAAFGNNALQNNKEGYQNTAIGMSSLFTNESGDENIGIGYGAGNTNTTGNRNTIIGVNADVSYNNLFNTTVIGYNAKATSSNTIVLGNPLVYRIGGPVGWTSSSDLRIKKNIRDTRYGLSTVMQLRPVEYTLISSDLKQVGFIAQEVNKLVPEVITGVEGDLEKGEILGITYANLVAVLTKAIQEQQLQIEAQQKKIDYLIKLVENQK